MMQEYQIVLDSVLIIAFFALYGTVTWSLIKYSIRETYRFWAVGWVIYTIGAFLIILFPAEGLVPLDAFALAGMFVGATLIQNGSRERKLTRKRVMIYFAGIVICSSLFVVGTLFHWEYYLVFIPVGLYIAYVCFFSAKTVYKIKEPVGTPKLWLIGGLNAWGVSWLIFPLVAILPELYAAIMVIQAFGVVVTGASMLTLFMRTVTSDLERQHKVTQIMSGLVQHDIRNYIQVARLALDLTENSGITNEHWIKIASDSLDGAIDFVDEMRDIASSLSRFKIEPEPFSLLKLVNSVKQRVVTEYSVQPEKISVQISEDTIISSCRLINEVLWNIFDNAFKHGSEVLLVNETLISNPHVILEISDCGGGLSDDIKDFLNNPNSLSENVAPGMGLGIILIQGLANMCGFQLHVEDVLDESKIVGTKYILRFKTSN